MTKVYAHLKCPVCQTHPVKPWSRARDYEYHSVPDEFMYYHCPSCDTIFLHPLPEDRLATIYPSNYYSFVPGKKGWVFALKEWLDLRLFKKILKKIPGDSIQILDAGGGTGWLLDSLRRQDERIHLTQVVDIDSKAGQIARQKGHHYFEGRIEDFRSVERFHLILMLNLIEHVADPELVLKNLKPLLGKDGIILIKTPQTRSLDARLFQHTYWGGLHCPRHWTIFSEKSFRMMAERTGLKVEKYTYTQGGPFWAFSIIIALARKGWLKTSAERPVIFHPLFPLLSAFFAIFDFIRKPFAPTSQVFITLKNP